MSVIARNNVSLRGEGQRPMIFAHGFGCDQNMWRHVTPVFEDDYKTVLFDHVGCGNSDLNAYMTPPGIRALQAMRPMLWRLAVLSKSEVACLLGIPSAP